MEQLVRPAPSATKLAAEYREVRSATESICSKLLPEDYVCQPVVWVSPPKWHLAHTTWFFETFVLQAAMPEYKVFDADYNFLFNSYYETVGARVERHQRGNLFRPPISDIYTYRKYVDDQMMQLLESGISDELKPVIVLGLQHEQQHQELLFTDIKYIFSQNPLLPAVDASLTLHHLARNKPVNWLRVQEGVYEIGYDGRAFCFDNELGVHKQYIAACSLADRPVTNAEYLAFIEAGGYHDFRYWLSEGWEWVKTNKVSHPMYWYLIDGAWHTYHLDGLKALDPALPLMHISYYEADAFARWSGLRLPTEFEWETAARLYPQSFENMVWEWTASAYLPYRGFKTADGAIGEYNGKFMVNQMVLRGGSIATPKGHSRVSYRNFFPPDMQWQFSGIRLAKDD